MAKKREHPIREVVPPEADDLQVINGIGPAVEHRLHAVGIFRFTQLAALSPADIAASVADLTGLTAERIIRQDWIGQARHLAAVTGSSQAEEEQAPVSQNVAVSAETAEDPTPVAADVGVMADEETATPVAAGTGALVDEETAVPEDVKEAPAAVEESGDAQQVANVEEIPSAILPQTVQGLTGTLQIRAMELVGSTSIGSRRVLHYDEPFDIRLTLDLSGLSVPEDMQLQYRVSIYGKNRVSRSGRFARESEGSFTPADTVTIELENNMLSEGTYQLAASVILALPHMQLTPKPGSIALIDGGVVQVS